MYVDYGDESHAEHLAEHPVHVGVANNYGGPGSNNPGPSDNADYGCAAGDYCSGYHNIGSYHAGTPGGGDRVVQ